jgi:hypothetical protein
VPSFLFVAGSTAEAPVLPEHRYRSRLSLLAIALALLAVLSASFGRDSVAASGTSPAPSQLAGAGQGPGVVVASFSVTDDLSTAVVGLMNGQNVTFVGPQGQIEADGAGMLRIPLDFRSATGPTAIAVSAAGRPADVIQVNYYPAQYYRSIGIDSAGVIDLYTTLPRSNNGARSEDTSAPQVSPSTGQAAWDQIRAQDGFPNAEASIDDQIRQLYISFDQLNDPEVETVCGGTMTGIELYSAITLHSCYVACTGYAVITDSFLDSLEIPARYISLGGPYSYLPDGVLVESSESHDTTDMWVGGEWQWLDPTLRVLSAAGPDGSTLTLDALMRALSDSSSRSTLSFTRLNPATNEWQTLSWGDEDAAFRADLSGYLSADKIMLNGKG